VAAPGAGGAATGRSRLAAAPRARGFGAASPGGIAAPEPVGMVPELGVWLQRKVRGTAATVALAEPTGVALARRLAEAVHKLHEAGVATRRRHTMADELRILHRCLEALRATRPEWAWRLRRLLAACDRLRRAATPGPPCGIHRAFY